jgi:hypothetical protein
MKLVAPDGFVQADVIGKTLVNVDEAGIRTVGDFPGFGVYGHVQPAYVGGDGRTFWGGFFYNPANKDATFGWYLVTQPANGAPSFVWPERTESGALSLNPGGLFAHRKHMDGRRTFVLVPGFVGSVTVTPPAEAVDTLARQQAAAAAQSAAGADGRARAVSAELERFQTQMIDELHTASQLVLGFRERMAHTVDRKLLEDTAWAKGVDAAGYVLEQRQAWLREIAKQVYTDLNGNDTTVAEALVRRYVLEILAEQMPTLLQSWADQVGPEFERAVDEKVDEAFKACVAYTSHVVNSLPAVVRYQFKLLWNELVGTWDEKQLRWTGYRWPQFHSHIFNRFNAFLFRKDIIAKLPQRAVPELFTDVGPEHAPSIPTPVKSA